MSMPGGESVPCLSCPRLCALALLSLPSGGCVSAAWTDYDDVNRSPAWKCEHILRVKRGLIAPFSQKGVSRHSVDSISDNGRYCLAARIHICSRQLNTRAC